ncbi:MAG TPA: hypothetical protein VGA51_04350 [Casimicrobiaceae bacterium]
MNVRNIVGALMLAVGSLGFAAVGHAAKFIDVEIGVAPPAARVEVVPAPREGYVYEPGHYAWNGSAYVWVDSQFIRSREGREWRPYVLERRGERWHYRAGHWDDED